MNLEASLWRVGTTYPLGAMLSVGGLALLRATPGRFAWRRALGVLGVATAVLSIQPAALAAGLTWLVLVCAAALGPEPFPWRRLLREALLLFCGYALGAALSVVAMKYAEWVSPRAGLTHEPLARLKHVLKIEWFFVQTRQYYPRRLLLAHLGLGLAALLGLAAWLIWPRLRQGAARSRGLLLAPCLVGLVICPYLPLLPIDEPWVTFRLMYCAPLLFSGLATIALCAWRTVPAARCATLVVLAFLGVNYGLFARENAREALRRQECDRQVVRELERFAAAHDSHQVVVAPCPRDWNPYRLRFNHTYNHISAFQTAVPASFLRQRTSLEVLEDPVLIQRALAEVKETPPPNGFSFRVLRGTNIVVLVPA
jgi:hypothetical protein